MPPRFHYLGVNLSIELTKPGLFAQVSKATDTNISIHNVHNLGQHLGLSEQIASQSTKSGRRAEPERLLLSTACEGELVSQG